MFFVGFFFSNNVRYGQFLITVQTNSKIISVLPLKNLKIPTFIEAFTKLLKVHTTSTSSTTTTNISTTIIG